MSERIALYSPSLAGGGAERVMTILANNIAVRGFAVDLVLAKAEGPYLKEVSEKVRVVNLGASRVLASLPGLIRYFRREHPDAMLSAQNHANVVALWARQWARVSTRLIVSEHITLNDVACNSVREKRAHLIPWLMCHTYPWANGVVAVSSGVADYLAKTIAFPRNRIRVIYNPVVTDALINQSYDTVSHSWFTPGEPPVILAVGRLTPQKDFPTLIRSFARLRSKRSVRLVILGEGELCNSIEALVTNLGLNSDVLLPGFMDNPFAWMRTSALFVLSSAWEGLPTVLIEAMACATPVVSTDCPSGPAEILENGKWGRLVPVGDVEALAAAMAATLDEPRHPDVALRAMDFGVDLAVDEYMKVLGFNTYQGMSS